MKYYLFVIAALLYTPFVATATSCPVHTESAYKSNNNATVWYITPACTKQKFTSATMFFTYFDSWDSVQTISEGLLAQVETDDTTSMTAGPNYTPKNGDVIKTVNDPKVYFVIGSELRHISDELAYTGLGYKWDWIIDVDQAVIDRYTKGEAISLFTYQPTYALFKVVNDPKVYRIEPHPQDPKKNVYRHIANEAVFHSLGYRFDRVLTVIEPVYATDGVGEVDLGSTLEYGVNPMGVLIEGTPITSPSAARNIDVRAAIQAERAQATTNGYALRDEPLYGISFEYPEDYLVTEATPGLESLMATYQVVFSKPTNTSSESESGILFTATLFDPIYPVLEAEELMTLTDSEKQELLESRIDGVSLFGNNSERPELASYRTIERTVHPKLGAITTLTTEDVDIETETETTRSRVSQEAGYGIGFYNDTGIYTFKVIYNDATEAEMMDVFDTVLESIKLR